jgi:transketolase
VAGRDAWGNHLSYGVREFGMAAIMNGMALHGGFIPYGGTFLTFSDYSRNAIRMAALMKQRVIHVFTHDSIGLGEDGPTHQSVEHVPSLRLIPAWMSGARPMRWRPPWPGPTRWSAATVRALCLSRQNLPKRDDGPVLAGHVRKGGYILTDMDEPQAVLLATGSEVELALDAPRRRWPADGIRTRVVSMPCTSVFDRQSEAYQELVLPLSCPRWPWKPRTRTSGASTWAAPVWWWASPFGESAPASDLYEHFGITAARVVDAARTLVHRRRAPSRATVAGAHRSLQQLSTESTR